jgi:hypothetical protein
MEPAPSNDGRFVETSKRFARRILTVAENRFQLLMVEVQEERERLLRAILLALGGGLAGRRSCGLAARSARGRCQVRPVPKNSEWRAPGLGDLAGVSRPR